MRLLVIEDYQMLRKSLTKGLEEEGYSVDQTGDGNEGLWFAENNEYDAIILDLMLPGMDGLTILKNIRSKGRTAPVLILSAKDGVDDRALGLDRGADDYLIKPFAFKELLARVRSLIRRNYRQHEALLRVGDLELDTSRRAVRRGGIELALTPREYALLEYLATRQGEVVSRTDIWNHVYDHISENTSNVVDVHIQRLRGKLEQPGQAKLLHTRRGMGYILELRGEPEP